MNGLWGAPNMYIVLPRWEDPADGCGEQTARAANFILATGCRPRYPSDLPMAARTLAITSDDLFRWAIKKNLIHTAALSARPAAGGQDTSQ